MHGHVLPLGPSEHDEEGEESAMQAHRRAQTLHGRIPPRAPERAPPGAVGGAGALLRAHQAESPGRVDERVVYVRQRRAEEPQPGPGAARAVPIEAGGVGPPAGGTAPQGGRRAAAGAVRGAAGAAG